MSTTDAVEKLLNQWSDDSEPEEAQAPTPEPEEVEVEAPEALESGDADSGEPVRFSIDEILEHAEVSPEDVYMVVTANGEPLEVSYGEARQGYSREADYRRSTQQLAEERRAHQAEHEQRMSQMQEWARMANAQEERLDQWFTQGQQQLETGYGARMREAQAAGDTTQFLALKVERDDQERALVQGYQQEKANLAAAKKQATELWEAQVAEAERACNLKLRQTWDKCTTEQALSERKASIAKFVHEDFGVPEEKTLSEINSPILWELAYDAMRYRQARKGMKPSKGGGPTLSGGARRTSSELAVKGAKRKANELAEKQRKAKTGRGNMSAAQDRLAHQFAQSERGRAKRGLS